MRKSLTLPSFLLLILLSGFLLTGCSSSTDSHSFTMASLVDMPGEVQSAPVAVQEAYQFAVANPEVLTQLPCYCGCGGMGHSSNYSCYVAGEDDNGSPTFDNHALGCSICVDITQDAMRMLDQGKNVSDIRIYVDQTYARFGPSNMP